MCFSSNAKKSAAFTGLAVALLGGCQKVEPMPQADVLQSTPLVIDEAMQKREWPRQTVYYQNGDTLAGPTLYPFEPAGDLPDWQYLIMDDLVYLGNTVLLPFSFFVTPPWSSVQYAGVQYEPTNTAQPVLPASAYGDAATYQPRDTVDELPLPYYEAPGPATAPILPPSQTAPLRPTEPRTVEPRTVTPGPAGTRPTGPATRPAPVAPTPRESTTPIPAPAPTRPAQPLSPPPATQPARPELNK